MFMLFISCNQVWSERHKDNFFDQCIMSAYSASLSSQNQEFKKENSIDYCNCALGLLIEKYPNPREAEQAIINMSQEERSKFLAFCVEKHLKK